MSYRERADMTDLERRQAQIGGRLNEIAGTVNVLFAEAARLGAEAEELGVLGDGVRSLSHYFGWQMGLSAGNARQLSRVAHRLGDGELPRTLGLFEAGLLSLDQVGPIAARIPDGPDADEHFAYLAPYLLVSQIRKAVRHTVPADDAPRDRDDPDPGDDPKPRELSFGHRDDGTWGATINASTIDGAQVEAGLQAHMDALMLAYKATLAAIGDGDPRPAPPTWYDAFERMVEHSLGQAAAERPHSQRTKTIMHVDADTGHAALHLGPALSAAERALLACDGTIEVVMERHGIPVSVGREHRIVPDKTRLLIEQRDQGCAVPGCGTGGKLVAHHIIEWADGGPTDTANLICLCPHHHRAVHQDKLHIWGNADQPDQLVITDARKRRRLTSQSSPAPPDILPDPPNTPYQRPWGGPVDWWSWEPPHIPRTTTIPTQTPPPENAPAQAAA